MVTEKMIEAFVKASSVAYGDTMDCVRAGLEAALSTDAEPVAWMHPDAGWVHHDKAVIAAHCRKDGSGPIALYTHISREKHGDVE